MDNREYKEASVQCLRVGSEFLDRDDFCQTVVEIKPTERQLRVTAKNVFGEYREFHFRRNSVIEILS